MRRTAAFLVTVAVACTPATDSATTASSPATTTAAPTIMTTTSPAVTTVEVTSTTSSPGATATSATMGDEAEGSGCTPGPGPLPDGEWFGFVVATGPEEIEFDLACWFSGDAAARAAAQDGEESPPPNDYYIRNANPRTRTLAVAEGTDVVWYPQAGDPTSEETVPYPDWMTGLEERGILLGVWVVIEVGAVTAIREQWVP